MSVARSAIPASRRTRWVRSAIPRTSGVGGSNASANPCIDAAAAGAKAKQSSATDKIINGAGEAAQGIGQGAQELGQGAVDATKKAGEDAGQMLNDLGKNIGGVFGN